MGGLLTKTLLIEVPHNCGVNILLLIIYLPLDLCSLISRRLLASVYLSLVAVLHTDVFRAYRTLFSSLQMRLPDSYLYVRFGGGGDLRTGRSGRASVTCARICLVANSELAWHESTFLLLGDAFSCTLRHEGCSIRPFDAPARYGREVGMCFALANYREIFW
jgi:hypothetical protein